MNIYQTPDFTDRDQARGEGIERLFEEIDQAPISGNVRQMLRRALRRDDMQESAVQAMLTKFIRIAEIREGKPDNFAEDGEYILLKRETARDRLAALLNA
jgi:hypothetical protein